MAVFKKENTSTLGEMSFLINQFEKNKILPDGKLMIVFDRYKFNVLR